MRQARINEIIHAYNQLDKKDKSMFDHAILCYNAKVFPDSLTELNSWNELELDTLEKVTSNN
ncbi:hypothetical protein EHS13_10735 [Paenibacillus psychroresistens]|uniref:Uncharacterized protein n=1 Tax=Paenibacillus psychroresistens TaxID=1778678 RepID=A0A6B8RHV6_9BACL|nr:hypothetical protein [Paenibacillus psychroresistens]QGQ95324.1 hypothetical protein EHS13_10735 [Paenibacillus psychroresistens]